MLAGVIGWPVEHSRSPQIHQAAARATGVELDYTRFPVRPGDGARAARAMIPLGLRGLSVTMPHKEDVMAACDELSDSARRLQAVNHLTNDDGVIVGNNSDGAGFVAGFEYVTGSEIRGRTVAIMGSGGAARAIVDGCATAGASSVAVVARSDERATIAASVAAVASPAGDEALAAADIVVNATPLGMAHTEAEGQVAFSVESLRSTAVVVDIVYSPLVTPLLTNARARGLSTVDGLAMLAGQAAAQFSRWTGATPPLDALIDAAISTP